MAAVPSTITTSAQPPSLLAKLASKFSVEPSKMLTTLKSTAFKGDVSNEQMMALLIVADQYGLNPWTKEVYAFPDKNNGIVPVVGVDGWSRIINTHPQFDGLEFVDGPTGTGSLPEWIECVIYRKDRNHPIRTREYMAECKRGTGPWQSHPRRMLRHKATIQCARLAFGFVGIYDQDEAERMREARDITPQTTGAVADLNRRIAATDAVVDATEVRPAPPTFEQVEQHIRQATHADGLAIVRALIPKVESAEDREELAAMAAVRLEELTAASDE
jgi:phage recombination protein Bet